VSDVAARHCAGHAVAPERGDVGCSHCGPDVPGCYGRAAEYAPDGRYPAVAARAVARHVAGQISLLAEIAAPPAADAGLVRADCSGAPADGYAMNAAASAPIAVAAEHAA